MPLLSDAIQPAWSVGLVQQQRHGLGVKATRRKSLTRGDIRNNLAVVPSIAFLQIGRRQLPVSPFPPLAQETKRSARGRRNALEQIWVGSGTKSVLV